MGKSRRRIHLKTCEERNTKRVKVFRFSGVLMKFEVELLVNKIAEFKEQLEPLEGILDIYHAEIKDGYSFVIFFEDALKCTEALNAIIARKNEWGGYILKNARVASDEEAEPYWQKLEAKKEKRKVKKKERNIMRKEKKLIKAEKAEKHKLMLEQRDAKAHRKKRKRDEEKKKAEEAAIGENGNTNDTNNNSGNDSSDEEVKEPKKKKAKIENDVTIKHEPTDTDYYILPAPDTTIKKNGEGSKKIKKEKKQKEKPKEENNDNKEQESKKPRDKKHKSVKVEVKKEDSEM